MACVADEHAEVTVNAGPRSPRSIVIALVLAFPIARGIERGDTRERPSR